MHFKNKLGDYETMAQLLYVFNKEQKFWLKAKIFYFKFIDKH